VSLTPIVVHRPLGNLRPGHQRRTGKGGWPPNPRTSCTTRRLGSPTKAPRAGTLGPSRRPHCAAELVTTTIGAQSRDPCGLFHKTGVLGVGPCSSPGSDGERGRHRQGGSADRARKGPDASPAIGGRSADHPRLAPSERPAARVVPRSAGPEACAVGRRALDRAPLLNSRSADADRRSARGREPRTTG
jgi:hypothetical protein